MRILAIDSELAVASKVHDLIEMQRDREREKYETRNCLLTLCSALIVCSIFSPSLYVFVICMDSCMLPAASCWVGLDKLRWHNFENNRCLKELRIMLE